VRLCNKPRSLVSIMTVNNETGVMQDVVSLRAELSEALFHTDAVQAFGKVSVDVQSMGVDFATISAHKINGPKGIGAMFIRKGIDFKAHQQGGGQERNRRAGTESAALIVGFQTAARNATKLLESHTQHFNQLTQRFIEQATNQIPDIRVNTPKSKSAPHIINLSFLDAENIDGEAIIQAMDMAGVAVSNGSACVSGSQQPSHVLLAMGRSQREAMAAVRISVGTNTTPEDIDQAVTILAGITRSIRV